MVLCDINACNKAQVWQRLYGKMAQTRRHWRLKVGDNVRLSQRIKPFKKGYLPQWTEEVFRIRRVIQRPMWLWKNLTARPCKARFTWKIYKK